MSTPSKRAAAFAEVFKVAFLPVLFAILGTTILVFDLIIDPPGDYVASSIGFGLLGLSAANTYDRIDRIVDVVMSKGGKP